MNPTVVNSFGCFRICLEDFSRLNFLISYQKIMTSGTETEKHHSNIEDQDTSVFAFCGLKRPITFQEI